MSNDSDGDPGKLGTKDFLSISNLDHRVLERLLELAAQMKKDRRLGAKAPTASALSGHHVALLFEKPSLRTRHSSEMAVVQLGGHPLVFRADEVGPRSREPLADIAQVLSGYHAAFGARVFAHADLEVLAACLTKSAATLHERCA